MALTLLGCAQHDNTEQPDTPAADEGWIVVSNDTGVTLIEFNAVPVDSADGDWGLNQFGDQSLEHGKTFTLKGVPCPDRFHLRALGEAGEEATLDGIDVNCGASAMWEVNGFPG